MLREVAFGQDGNFSEDLFIEKSNSDLSNNLGNLVSRVTAMVQKYNNGIITKSKNPEMLDYDKDLISSVSVLASKVEGRMDQLELNKALG